MMQRTWRTVSLATLLLVLLAACGRMAPEAAPLATLSRGQISFGSLSFAALPDIGYTNVSPLVEGTAKGLGSDTYEVELWADWELVLVCINNGNNVPQGAVNYPLVSGLGIADLVATDRNGRAEFAVDSSPGKASAAEIAFANLDLEPAVVCPNANYTLAPLGARYQKIGIDLWNPDGTLADSIVFVCSDPANPSAETCTTGGGKKKKRG